LATISIKHTWEAELVYLGKHAAAWDSSLVHSLNDIGKITTAPLLVIGGSKVTGKCTDHPNSEQLNQGLETNVASHANGGVIRLKLTVNQPPQLLVRDRYQRL